MNKVNILVASGLIIALTGCTTLKSEQYENPEKIKTKEEIRDEAVKEMEKDPGITHMPGYTPLTIEKPIVMPKDIRNKKINLTFNNNTTFRDLPSILGALGVTTVIKNDGLSEASQLLPANYADRREQLAKKFNESQNSGETDSSPNAAEMQNLENLEDIENEEDIRDYQLYTYLSEFRTKIEDIQLGLPKYEGTMIGFLNLLADLHNVSFNWKYGNYLVIERYSDYVITVPQEEELMSEIVTEIEKLNAQDVTSSLRAGTITYKATKNNHNRVTRYINRLTYNSPDVGIQMAIVSVELSEDLKKGFDWSQLQAGIGGDSGGNASTISVSGNTLGITLSGSEAEINTAISILDEYGVANTEQSVLLKTIGGKPVDFNTVQEIPYVSDVQSEVIDSNTEGNSDNVSTNVITDTAEVGLTIKLTPFYDADSQLLTMDIDFESSNVLSFAELTTEIRQPNIQRQTFNNSVKIKPGEAIILGGLTYESVSDDKKGLNMFEDRLNMAHTSYERTRRAMFIILRPNVKIYGNFNEKEIIQE